MKRIIAILLVTTTILSLIRCRVYNYVTVDNYSRTANFNSYYTYAWLPDLTDTCATPYNNRIIRDNTRNYFSKSFSAIGYSFQTDTPDVLLQLVIINKKMKEEVFYFPSNTKYFSGNEYYQPDTANKYYAHKELYCYPMGYCSEKIEYVRGAIALNLIDRRKNELVWTCTAEGNIYDPVVKDKDIHPAVKAIMKKYPSKKK